MVPTRVPELTPQTEQMLICRAFSLSPQWVVILGGFGGQKGAQFTTRTNFLIIVQQEKNQASQCWAHFCSPRTTFQVGCYQVKDDW